MIKRTMEKSWPQISYREGMPAIRGSEDRGRWRLITAQLRSGEKPPDAFNTTKAALTVFDRPNGRPAFVNGLPTLESKQGGLVSRLWVTLDQSFISALNVFRSKQIAFTFCKKTFEQSYMVLDHATFDRFRYMHFPCLFVVRHTGVYYVFNHDA